MVLGLPYSCALAVTGLSLLLEPVLTFTTPGLPPVHTPVTFHSSSIYQRHRNLRPCSPLSSLSSYVKNSFLAEGCLSGEKGYFSARLSASTALFASENTNDNEAHSQNPSPLLLSCSKSLKRLTFYSWWSQLILLTISLTTTLFVTAITSNESLTHIRDPAALLTAAAANHGSIGLGLYPSTIGLLLGSFTLLQTLLLRRVARRISKEGRGVTVLELKKWQRRVRRLSKAVIVGNIVGMGVTIVGMEQIVGVLVAKTLSQGGLGGGIITQPAPPSVLSSVNPIQAVRAIDIFIVQAGANTMLSHLISLVCGLGGWKWVRRLEDEEREIGASNKMKID